MKLSIMQPYLFPYIGYFQLLDAADKFVVYDDVNFIKKGWINRNNILINSQKYPFVVPLREVSQNKLICEIQIADGDTWRNKFLRTLAQNYKKAAFYDEIYPLIEEIISSNEAFISKMIVKSLRTLAEKLVLSVEILESSGVYDNRELKGQARILDICRKENAVQYINSAGGSNLYKAADFAQYDIELSFLQTLPFSYAQTNSEFVAHLSIIDVLMFNGFERTKEHLKKYVLS